MYIQRRKSGCGCSCGALIVIMLIIIGITTVSLIFSSVGVMKNMYKYNEEIAANVQEAEVYVVRYKDAPVNEKENIVDYGEVLAVAATSKYILVETTNGIFAISGPTVGSTLNGNCVLLEINNNKNIVTIEDDEIVFPDKVYIYPKPEVNTV